LAKESYMTPWDENALQCATNHRHEINNHLVNH